MESLNTLQRILNSIALSLDRGTPDLYSVLTGFMAFFFMLALVMLCYGLLWHGRVIGGALGLMIRLALISFALTRWPWVLAGLRDLGVTLGLLVTGGQLSVVEFLDPGALIQTGLKSASTIWTAFQAHTGLSKVFTALPLLFAWFAYCAAFAVMAYKVFWWQVELLIAGAAGMCLLPCLVLRQTAFLATGVLSYAANAFARFLLGAVLAGVLWRHLDVFAVSPLLSQQVGVNAAVQAASAAVAIAWVLAACFLSVNKLAGVLTSGIPGMAGGQSLGALARTVATGGALVATAGAAGVVGASAAAGGARAGVQAIAGLHSGSLHTLQEAARATFAGVQAGAHGQHLGRLTTLMRGADPTRLMGVASQLTLRQLMQASRQPHDQTHSGARHHP